MKNLNPKTFSFLIFVAFGVCFMLVAVLTGHRIQDFWSVGVVAYKTIPILLILVAAFVLYAWRWRLFRNWLVPFPDLNGTWQGSIQTTWQDPQTGATPGPIPAVLTIKQTFTRISCVMRTPEMTSRSYLADFWLNGDEQIRKLGYCYNSVTLPSVAHRSAPHDGTMVFEIVGEPAEKLVGTYWTSRKTTGEVTLTLRCRDRLDEFPADLGKHPMSASPSDRQ